MWPVNALLAPETPLAPWEKELWGLQQEPIGKKTPLGGRHQGILQSLFAVPGGGFRQLALRFHQLTMRLSFLKKLSLESCWWTPSSSLEGWGLRQGHSRVSPEPGVLHVPQSFVAFGCQSS